MNIIAGLRRSGTSLLMFALKEAGFKITGEKFYKRKTTKQVKEGNPNGYWEVDIVTTRTGLQRKIKGEVVKIMFEALPNSKPELIDKVILIFREPKKILSSILKNNSEAVLEEYILMGLFDTIDTLGFLEFHKKEYMLVFYGDILKNPKEELKKICVFLGKGDYIKAAKAVDQKLDRSEPLQRKCRFLPTMEKIYELAKANQIDEILKLEKQLQQESQYFIKGVAK